MRISQLSGTSGVPIPTIKYYLREGLLTPGELTARNQAEYGEAHLHQLRLIRVLIDVGGLGIAAVREVLGAIADEQLSVHEMLGVSHYALGPPPDPGPVSDDVMRARQDVNAFLASRGWQVSADAPARRKLADALVALRRLGRDEDADVFAPYADVAEQVAARELACAPEDAPRAQLVEHAVVGTVVFEAALSALRMLAQEHHSAMRFGQRRRRRPPVARGRTRAPRSSRR